MQKTVVATAMIKHNSNVSWSSFLKTLLAKLQQKLVHPQNFMPKYHLETEEKIKIKMDRYSEFKFNSAGVRMTTKTRRQSFTTMPPCDYTTIRLLTDDYWHWISRNSRFLKVFYPCTKFPINSVKMDLICKSKKETTKTQFGIYIYIFSVILIKSILNFYRIKPLILFSFRIFRLEQFLFLFIILLILLYFFCKNLLK